MRAAQRREMTGCFLVSAEAERCEWQLATASEWSSGDEDDENGNVAEREPSEVHNLIN